MSVNTYRADHANKSAPFASPINMLANSVRRAASRLAAGRSKHTIAVLAGDGIGPEVSKRWHAFGPRIVAYHSRCSCSFGCRVADTHTLRHPGHR